VLVVLCPSTLTLDSKKNSYSTGASMSLQVGKKWEKYVKILVQCNFSVRSVQIPTQNFYVPFYLVLVLLKITNLLIYNGSKFRTMLYTCK